MWTCITVTCRDVTWASAITEELSILNSQNLLSSQLCVISPDCRETEGDGEATLNALLVTLERLTNMGNSKNGRTFGEILAESHILIVHRERLTKNPFCYWPNGLADFPTQNKNKNGSGLETYIEFITNLGLQLKEKAPPGVWVASTDCILSGYTEELFNWPVPSPDALVITLHCQHADAIYCDSVSVRKQGEAIVESLSFLSPDETSTELKQNISSGIVYLKSTVATRLLSLSSKFPLHRCTYFGEDNGAQILQLSLLYDLLGPLWVKDKTAYLSGDMSQLRDNIIGLRNDEDKVKARLMLWEELHEFQLYAAPVPQLNFVNWTALPLEKILRRESLFLASTDQPAVLNCSVKQNEPAVCINSVIESNLYDNELVMISSSIQSVQLDRFLRLAGRAYLLNTKVNLDEIPEFYLNDNVCMIGYWIRVDKEIKLGRSLFAATDIPILECNHPRATVFGLNCWKDLLWLQDIDGVTESRLESWRNSKRYSMEDFHQLCDPQASLHNLRLINTTAILGGISRWPGSLAPYFRRACAEKWSDSLLSALDQAALKSERRDFPRLLAAIADLLAWKAGSLSGVRNGPATNKEWISAFHLLEHSLHDAVPALAHQRTKWLGTPELLIRAARHYDRTVHILTRETVKSVQNHMVKSCDISITNRPLVGEWVESECPARLDLSGGWSDTPPICYEIGGSVVNVAILVDGEKPIGARGRRLEKFQLVLVSEGQSEPLVISSIDQVMDYNNPTAPGALLKASLICAGVVQGDCRQDLPQQLEKTLGSGLELHCWSKLPTGSGLGTSSILASALLAVIYHVMGYKFNRSHLIHAVLHIEQLLTTGGGWQDQVAGVMGGCNRGHSFADPNVQVHVEKIFLSEQTVKSIDQRLLLVHTGKVRLAKNLLQNVIRMWYAREEATTNCFSRLIENSYACKNAMLQGNIDELCGAVDNYWKHKKLIAPGCEPHMVKNLMHALSDFVYGQSLAGAGGGGFYYGFLKRPEDRSRVESSVTSIEGCQDMIIHRATVDLTGISLKVGGEEVNIP
ncbi:hypothetical protein GHT06_011739 [Daphnia sinensis]|uniref:L-fucose kinase n=1 Tax=Daphnia sinensis TaxID=1820382 RepID=A0AAD5KUL4_9CRUS|nr:hypothetical protein GHT06_011739 [Daphnia sinensis]